MPSETRFRDDVLINLICKCILFPADGSQQRIVDMINRTVTTDDTSVVGIYNRTLDLTVNYGSELRKTRVRDLGNHLLFYNLSPKLPLNRCIARIVGVDPDRPGSKLFWRGDVVVMRFETKGEYSPYINCLEAYPSAIGDFEEVFRRSYKGGDLERELTMDEEQGALYRTEYNGWLTTISATISGDHPYWGSDWRRKEADFFNDINELKEYITDQQRKELRGA